MPPFQDTLTTSDDEKPFLIPLVFVISREWLQVIIITAFLLGLVIGVVTRSLRRSPPRFEDKEKGAENEKEDKVGMQVMDNKKNRGESSMKTANEADYTKNERPPLPHHSLGNYVTRSLAEHPSCTSPSPPVVHATTLTPIFCDQPNMPHQPMPDEAIYLRAGHQAAQSRRTLRDSEEKLRNTVTTRKGDQHPIPDRKHRVSEAATELLLADEVELKKLRQKIQALRKGNVDLVVENAALKRRCQMVPADDLQDLEEENMSNARHQENISLLSKYDESGISQNDQNNVPNATRKQQLNLPESACDDSEAKTKKLQEWLQALGAPDPAISLRLQDEKAQTQSSASQLEESAPEKEPAVDSTRPRKRIKRGVQRLYLRDPSTFVGTAAGTFREQPLHSRLPSAPAVLRLADHEANLAPRSIAREYRSGSVSSPALPSLNTTNIHKDIAARGPRTNTVVIGPVKSVQALMAVIPELVDTSKAESWYCENRRFFTMRFEDGPGDAAKFVKKWDERGLVECPDAILWYAPDGRLTTGSSVNRIVTID